MLEKRDRKKVGAIWLTVFLGLITSSKFVISILRNNFSISTFSDIATVALIIGIIVLIRKKRYTIAFFVGLIVDFFQVGILDVLSRTGTGYHMSIMFMIIGVVYAILLLSGSNVSRGVLATIVLGIVPCAIDLWVTQSRTVADGTTEKITMTLAMIMAGVVIFIWLRLWKDFDFSTKMIILVIIGTIAALTFLQTFIVFNHAAFAQQLLAASQDIDTITELVRKYNQQLTLLGSFGLALVSFLGLVMAMVTTKPLRSMVKEVDTLVNTGDLNCNIQTNSADEIGQLGQALQRLMEYIKNKAATAVRLSKGDLTENIQTLSETDTLGNAYRQMLTNLNKVLFQVSDSAQVLNSTSIQLAQTAEVSGVATAQISETIRQVASGIIQETQSVTRTSQSVDKMARAIAGVAQGAAEQSMAVNDTVIVANRIHTNIEQVITGIDVVSKNSTSAEKAAIEGSQIVQTNLEGMSAIKNQVTLSTQKVEEMGHLSQNIGIILETISEIAEQTNLLALNAAIEAARAGEAGKGFSVVADEVRKLAERSGSATKEIGDLIRNIQQTVAEAVSAMRESTTQVERGVEYSNSASRALADILESVKMVNGQTDQVSSAALSMRSAAGALTNSVEKVSAVVEENTAATEEMSAGSEVVVEAMESISSVSEENNAAVEEVSASADEISAQAKEVTDLARSAAAIAKSLNEAVSIFQLAENNS